MSDVVKIASVDRMPVIFIGHGSPMNAIEDNEYTKSWRELGTTLPRPKAILAISAHWFTSGTRISDAKAPETIYDMYGFPKELYEIKYSAPGSPELAHKVIELLSGVSVKIDDTWGLDHGSWSVLHAMYPAADIPVVQLSIDRNATPQEHFILGQKLQSLRDEGVLIFGSGNVVHNLSLVSFGTNGGFPWAYDFDEYIKNSVMRHDFDSVQNYKKAGAAALKAFPTPEHFNPLLYVLGSSDNEDSFNVINEECVFGSLSMTCYISYKVSE